MGSIETSHVRRLHEPGLRAGLRHVVLEPAFWRIGELLRPGLPCRHVSPCQRADRARRRSIPRVWPGSRATRSQGWVRVPDLHLGERPYVAADRLWDAEIAA